MCNAQGQCVATCNQQCQGKECGDDGCGGQCGSCGFDQECNDQGQCVATCDKQCLGKECGDDGCGGQCGSCGFDQVCTIGGLCVPQSEADAYELDPTVGGDADVVEASGDAGPPGNRGGPCPAGQAQWYGKCVPRSQLPAGESDDGLSEDGGCTFAPRKARPATYLLLLAALAFFAIRRRSGSRAS